MPFDSRLKKEKQQAVCTFVGGTLHSNCSGPEARAQEVSRSIGRPGQKDHEQEEFVDELRQVRGRGEW